MADNSDNSALADALQEVTTKAQLLVREEIELAKAEVTTKGKALAKGAAVAVAAGIFAVTGLLFALHTLAWLLWRLISDGTDNIFLGFLIVTLLLFGLAAIAALLGFRWIKKGAPPTPDLAIEEAQRIRDTVRGDEQKAATP